MGNTVKETSKEHGVDLLCLFRVFVHVPAVVIFKALRDAHTMRTWHAVLASGAGDYTCLLYTSDAADE